MREIRSDVFIDGMTLLDRISRRQFLGGAAAMAAGAVFDSCAPTTNAPTESTTPSAEPTPTDALDVVFRGGTILTMDPEQPGAEAVAIRGDSIAAVGSESEVMAAASPGAMVVDLGDRVLLPGFNDAHCHRIDMRARPAHVQTLSTPGAEGVIQDALAGGWTSISEMLLMAKGLDELRSLDDEGRLRLRVNAYLAPYPPGVPDDQRFGIWFGDYEPRQTVSPRLRIGGVKLFADSYAPAAPLHMLLTEVHADRPGYLGDAFWEPDEFRDLARTLHDGGWQVATHTLGDAAHDFVLDAYEAALAGADNDLHRHRIEHAFLIRDDQVARMRDLGVIASIQLPLMSADWAADWKAALGPERLGWAGRWRDLLEAGVPTVGGTDFPAVMGQETAGRSSAMRALWDGATRTGVEVVAVPDWMTDQALTVEQGLDLLTRAGAYATFEEDRKGTITVGKLADLVITSDDPRAVPIADLPAVKVVMTMIGGRVEYGSL